MNTKISLLLFSFILGGKLFPQNEDDTIREKAKEAITVLNYMVIEPENSNSLSYRDSIIEVDFDVLSDQLGFHLRNETSKPTTVVWDDASPGIFNVSHKVMHSGTEEMETLFKS